MKRKFDWLAAAIILLMLTLAILPGGCKRDTTGKHNRGKVAVELVHSEGSQGGQWSYDSVGFLVKRGAQRQVTCRVFGRLNKIYRTAYQGKVRFVVECPEGVTANRSQWETQLVQESTWQSSEAPNVTVTFTIADDAPLGPASARIIGTTEDDVTHSLRCSFQVVDGAQTISAPADR